MQVVLDRGQLGVLLLGLLDEGYLLGGLLDGPLEVAQVNGLGGEVEGALVHGAADVVHVAVGGDHDAL